MLMDEPLRNTSTPLPFPSWSATTLTAPPSVRIRPTSVKLTVLSVERVTIPDSLQMRFSTVMSPPLDAAPSAVSVTSPLARILPWIAIVSASK